MDFDGTITKKDIGDELFIVFGKFEPYHSQLIECKINITDYWHNLCNNLNDDVSEDTIVSYAETCGVNPYFIEFANYCKKENVALAIVSDGFESYIKPILKREKLDWIPVFCNKLIFSEGEKPKPIFPNASEVCKCLSASCKRNLILSNSPPEAIIIFIGDGYSDYCPAEHSDIIFAKNALAKYCNENKIPHYSYNTFFEVLRIMQLNVQKNKFKVRNQAKLLRKKAFEIE